MSDDLDPQLRAYFEAARAPLAADPFMTNLMARVQGARRARQRRQAMWIGLGVVLLAWRLPTLLAFSAHLADRLIGALTPPASPPAAAVSWLLSLPLAALVLWRSAAVRRR